MEENLKELIRKHDIISFDIFDTLLIRPYARPSDLFLHLEKLYQVENFAKNRIQAEKKAREKYYSKEEVTYDQIYEQLDKVSFSLKEKEIQLEKQILRAHPLIKEVYDFAISLNKKIILTSDMYLPKHILEEILVKNGYKKYHKFYLSSDLMKSKSASTLYTYIIEDLKVEPKKIIHIGDDFHSDYKMANKLGIDVFLHPKPIDNFFEKNPKIKSYFKDNSQKLGASIIIGVLANFYLKNRDQNYWYNFGFIYGGPTIYAYVKWLDQELKKDNIDQALFIARDGYTLQKVFEMIKTSEVESKYVYAPRSLNLICNLDYANKLSKTNSTEELVVVRMILAFFKNKNEFLKKHTPNTYSIKTGIKFINDNIEIYKKLSLREKKNYKDYLNSIKINLSCNLGLIDTASCFFNSFKLIDSCSNVKKITGYYWFASGSSDKEFKEKHKIKEFDTEFKYDEKFDWNIVEFLMTAPEPVIETICKNQPKYKILNNYEEERMLTYKFICDGEVDFSRFITNWFEKINTFVSVDDIVALLKIFNDHPEDYDKEMFSKIFHAWDADHKNYIPVIKKWYQTICSQDNGIFNSRILKAKEIILIQRINRSLFKNIILSKIIFGKNRLKYHQNVWYLKKELEILKQND